MHLVVIGIGLIGGSFALGARAAGLFDSITGIDPDHDRAERAVALGIVDRVAGQVPEDADAVLIAGPSHTVAGWVCQLAGHRALLFDAASVKGGILTQIRARLGHLPPHFVPGHPIAGSERSGPDAAAGDLFHGCEVVLTPGRETDPDALAVVGGWWRALGARIAPMDEEEHDRVLAVTSHLPHLVAIAYLQQVESGQLRHAAGGFRDFTRIAGSDPEMWAPIFLLNRPALLDALDALETSLGEFRAHLEQHDDSGLKALIERARERRREFDDGA